MRNKLKSTRIILLLLLWVVPTWQLFGQELQIHGKITDASTGEALPGVSIQVKGTNQGTVSSIDGTYKITAQSGSVLIFSFVGFKKHEILIENSQPLDVKLEIDAAKLDEIVVIGYGTVKKNDATGAVATISAKDFNKGAIATPQDLLVGKSAGVVITTSGGAPGSEAKIRIRGGSSLNASNDPLIIIDAVPIDNNDIGGSANLLSFINPNDIETFTVLKDASATAIYGSRASNGVILITTKKGKAGPMRITYDANTSVSSAIKFMDVYSGDEIRQIAYDHRDLFGVDSYTKLGQYNTDWQKEIFRTSFSQDHTLGVSGTYKNVPYRVSLGYTNQNGILKNTALVRETGSISLDPTLLNNSLKISINAKGMNTDNNFGDAGAIGSAINMDPTHPVKDYNSNSNGYFQWANYGASLGTANPVEQLLDYYNKSNVMRGVGNIQFDYSLPMIKGLRANLNLATDYSESSGRNKRPTSAPSVLTNPYWGYYKKFTGKNYNNLLDFYLNYVKEVSAIRSKIDVTAGYSWQHFKREKTEFTSGYSDENHPVQPTIDIKSITENYLVSFFGRLNYTLLDKYLLTFTFRDDGTSRFIGNNKWGLFPSAAFAWKIKEESFLKNVNVISDFKLRLGWGVTGQQDLPKNLKNYDYPAQALYGTSVIGNYYMVGGQYIPTLRPAPYDPTIKWEQTTTQNIGIDFGLLKDRITGSIDVYKRLTDNLLNRVTIPTGSNFSNTLLTNVGSLENTGTEVTLNLIPISNKDMSLNLGFNFSYNKNKITKLLLSDDPNYIGILYGDAMTGQKQVTRVGNAAYSFFVNKQVYDANGNPIEGLYVDLAGKGGTINGNNDNKYIFHKPAADYLIGFTFRFNYKSFDLSASTRGSIGNYVYNQVAAGASYDQMYQIGYWKNFPKYLNDTKFVKRQFTSDYFVENASFFKVDNVSAGYRFSNVYKKLNIRVSFTIQNLMTITKYKGIDPEVPFTSVNDVDVPGIDNNFYPRARTFMIGVNLSY